MLARGTREGIGADEFKGHPEHGREYERRKSRMPDLKGKHKAKSPTYRPR